MQLKIRRWIIAIGMGMSLLSALMTGCRSVPDFYGTVLDPAPEAADFLLTDQEGRSFRLSDQRDAIVLLYFGYTACPDVCPTTLSIWKEVREQLGADGEKVRFVLVTVDPERDTPQQLNTYLDLYKSDFIGLTGTPEMLDPIYKSYNVYHQKVPRPESGLGYMIDHTATTFIIDPEGRWRLVESYGTPAADLLHDLRLLLP